MDMLAIYAVVYFLGPLVICILLARWGNRRQITCEPVKHRWVVITLFCITAFASLVPYTLFRPVYLWEVGLGLSFSVGLIALVLWVAISSTIAGQSFALHRVCCLGFLRIFIINTFVISTVISYNAAADDSPPEPYAAVIIEKFVTNATRLRSSSMGSKPLSKQYNYIYQLPRLPNSPFPNRLKDVTYKEKWEKIVVGKDHINLEIHAGKLGIPWFDQQVPTPPKQQDSMGDVPRN